MNVNAKYDPIKNKGGLVVFGQNEGRDLQMKEEADAR
jgi:hypothetical protein